MPPSCYALYILFDDCGVYGLQSSRASKICQWGCLYDLLVLNVLTASMSRAQIYQALSPFATTTSRARFQLARLPSPDF